MVRTTIVLPEEEFRELKRLAAQQDRPISWLLRQAFRLSRVHLERGEPYGATFDRVWSEIGRSLRRAGVRPPDVKRFVAEAREGRPRKGTKAGAR
jgi:D-serine deaminase-like pyridoxal phosphate-dependent protein